MATFGGFIASALGGAAKGYGEGAQMEMKKQAELDLKKQLMEAELEKASRLDDIKRQRDVTYARAETAYNQNPDTIAAVVKADVDKVKALIRSGLTTEEANLAVQKGKAAAGVQTDLLPVTEKLAKDVAASGNRVTEANAPGAAAAAATVVLETAKAEAAGAPALMKAYTEKFNASKVFKDLEASEATAAQIKKAKALVADPEYMKALEKTDLATHAGVIRVAQINKESAKDVAKIRADSAGETSEDRLEAARLRGANKGPGGGGTNPTTADLQRQVTAAENALAAKLTVKKTDLNEELGVLQKRTDPASKDKLAKAAAEIEALAAARKRLLEWSKTPAAAASAPAAAAFVPAMPPSASTLPPLKPGMFDTKK